MRVVFMGTPEFAVPCLETVCEEHDVAAVVTQPDRKKGRGQKVSFSPVKAAALERDLEVLQPERVSTPEFIDYLTQLKADVFVVVAFGQKIPDKMLTLAPHGCINVHSSLLPKYRGAAPINYAVANCETKTGVTTMYLSSQWDAGDIILQESETIYPDDTAGTLHDRLMYKGASLLLETLRQIEQGTAPRIPQNHAEATFAYKLSKEDAVVDFAQPACKLECLVRGMNPWPTAHVRVGQDSIKIWKAVAVPGKAEQGVVADITDRSLVIGCGEGLLALKEVQRPNGRRISGKDLANGLRLTIGTKL